MSGEITNEACSEIYHKSLVCMADKQIRNDKVIKMSSEFDSLILSLIQSKCENDYWDFKEQHHSNKADLLHDIICMSNNLANRDCYIIFGVTDAGDIIGVAQDDGRRSLQDFIAQLKEKSLLEAFVHR